MPPAPDSSTTTVPHRWGRVRFAELLGVWLILGLGLGLRFANLSGKPIWIDEGFSLFHVSGFSEAMARQQLMQNHPVTVAELMQYQGPVRMHGLTDTIDHIAKTSPELPPLYFLLLNCWMTVFGQSVMAIRSLGAIVGLFCFPALYWLCWELFGLPIVGWYAMALFAVSPFNFIMAQEARPYTLWTTSFLVASAALLRAQRTQHWRDWAIHTIALITAFYTHLFSVLLWLIYAVYVAVSARGVWRDQTVRRYGVVTLVTLLAFLPWIGYVLMSPADQDYKPFVQAYSSPIGLLKGLTRGIVLFFVDFNLNEKTPRTEFLLYLGLLGLVLVLVGYGFRYLWARSRGVASQFLIITTFLPIGLFLASDLLTGASRTAITRYFIPSGIAMQIVIAYMVASKQTMRFKASSLWSRWQKRFTALLLAGLLSCGWFILSPTWWSKAKTQANACIVKRSNGLDHPLLVTDEYFVRAMALGHSLKPTVRFRFLPSQTRTAPPLELGTTPTYLYLSTPEFYRAMNDRYVLRRACPEDFWEVVSDKTAGG